MPYSKKFEHLPLPLKIIGKAKFDSFTVKDNETTAFNKKNYQVHSDNLSYQSRKLTNYWQNINYEGNENNLHLIHHGIPLILEIDPNTNVDFLRNLGFEVICDLTDGFVIVSSEDIDLAEFLHKT
ncbi:MAG: hypothetical protein LBO66_06195 [Deltaproteobacteria bacterium]|jgi:hypothetical protein|nr:hypothetical protein [Deltaproteobacteria bacterium]